MIYTIENEVLKVSVRSDGGTMTSIFYKPTGEERQWQGEAFWKSQDVVIFPIVGHAKAYTVNGKTYEPKAHGVIRYSELTVKEQTADSITFSLDSNEQTKQTYPYDFHFELSYTLNGNSVTVGYFVQSKNGAIPYNIGGHPAMQTPGGDAVIEFPQEENVLIYPIGMDATVPATIKQFVANKAFFQECKTFQLGNIQSGTVLMHTRDNYTYTYQSKCPLWAFWSHEEGGDYVCVEPWWGINDFEKAPRELSLKPFMEFDSGEGHSYSYTLSVSKD